MLSLSIDEPRSKVQLRLSELIEYLISLLILLRFPLSFSIALPSCQLHASLTLCLWPTLSSCSRTLSYPLPSGSLRRSSLKLDLKHPLTISRRNPVWPTRRMAICSAAIKENGGTNVDGSLKRNQESVPGRRLV